MFTKFCKRLQEFQKSKPFLVHTISILTFSLSQMGSTVRFSSQRTLVTVSSEHVRRSSNFINELLLETLSNISEIENKQTIFH